MAKLHELLAVEGDLASAAQAVLKEVKGLLGSPEKFLGRVRTYRPLEEDGQTQPNETTNLSTTVDKELARLSTHFGNWLNASIQKEVTNQKTSADIVVGEQIIAERLPATALLNLESKLASLKSVLVAIPTNDTTERWEWDTEAEAWVSEPRITFSTKKTVKHHVAYEATKEHPAQVQAYNEDVRVGEWTTIIRSGMLRPSQKRDILERLDKLIMAVKAARQRANQAEIEDVQIAKKLLDYILE